MHIGNTLNHQYNFEVGITLYHYLMKQFFIIVYIALITSSLYAQDIPQPDLPKRPYYMHNGALQSLTKVVPKQKGLYNTSYTLKGKVAKTIFEAGSTLEFIFEYSGEQDLDGLFTILIGKRTKSGRIFKAGGFKAWGGKAKDNSKNELTYDIKKIKGSVYKLVIPDTPAGEYAIALQELGALLSVAKAFIYPFSVQ